MAVLAATQMYSMILAFYVCFCHADRVASTVWQRYIATLFKVDAGK